MVRGCRTDRKQGLGRGTALERLTEGGESPVLKTRLELVGILSSTEHANSV